MRIAPEVIQSAPRFRRQPAANPVLWLLLLIFLPAMAVAQQHFRGDKALEITRQFVAIGPRWVMSPGHAKAEAFLREQFKNDKLDEDTFTQMWQSKHLANLPVLGGSNYQGLIIEASKPGT